MHPSRTQIMAALETLGAAGYSLQPPASERVRLLSAAQVQELLGCGEHRARDIMREAGAVMLPGGDLRVRLQALDAWIARHSVPA